MMTPVELVEQRCDDAITTCTEAINVLDLAEGDLRNFIRSLHLAGMGDVAERVEKHLNINLKDQEMWVFVRGQIHAAIHTMPDRKVVHLEEKVF